MHDKKYTKFFQKETMHLRQFYNEKHNPSEAVFGDIGIRFDCEPSKLIRLWSKRHRSSFIFHLGI